MASWRDFLYLDDPGLLICCRQSVSRGSGPGGQKRNKTSNSVQIIHKPTGLAVRASEERSQKVNKNNALNRLRMEIALRCRAKFDVADYGSYSHKNPITIAILLDALNDSDYVIADAAEKLSITTAKLSKLICNQIQLLDEVNRQRKKRELRTLKSSDK